MGDTAVFVLVIAARFLIPLAIPRYPLPAILAALVIDGVDQTIFQTFTSLALDGYQGYDKALDVYYLTIAYISTMRNWLPGTAFEVARFLWYYRLVGVLAFELSGARPLLIIFPNTFEYYFIFYEAVRVLWHPARLSSRTAIGAAAAIWIGIKLPQEYWIHIAQLDVTDILGAHPWLIAVIGGIVVIAARVLWPLRKRLPPPDHPPRFDVEFTAAGFPIRPGQRRVVLFARSTLAEKIALVAMVTVIFAQIMPSVQARVSQITVSVALVVTANAVFSHWLAKRGTAWYPALREFGTMCLVNLGIVFGFYTLLRRGEGSLNLGTTLFFVLLLTLIVMLFDRYHYVRFRTVL